LDKREAGRRLAASYVNYYQGKDFIILPAFGVKEDALALKTIQELYPNKTVHQVLSREILARRGQHPLHHDADPREGGVSHVYQSSHHPIFDERGL
jgi:agmatine/peptidylarginine deiminase